MRHLVGRTTAVGGCLSARQLADLADLLGEAANPVLVLGPEVDAEAANEDAVITSSCRATFFLPTPG